VQELELEGTEEAKSRIENIREFQSVALEFVRTSEEENPSLEDFLAQISLVADTDNIDSQPDRVMLMTMHSAKGLEFPVVFLGGLEEGLFPSYRSIGEESEMEEERRLCYVGITRAREQLYMTCAKCRMLFGNTTYNRTSRFLDEIPGNLFDDGTIKPQKMLKSTPVFKTDSLDTWKQRTASFAKAEELNMDGLDVGVRVIHKKFGKGTVLKKVPEGTDFRLEIDFDDYGMKRLMASFAKLKQAE
jgi:DNA helicase-2/ATP-dependent DNA helicase PcrA